MYGETVLESLIQRIYEAAVGSASWVSFLVLLAGTLDSGLPTLYFVDPINRQGSLAISVGMDEKAFREYGKYYHERNVWIQGAAARDLLRPGVVRLSDDMCQRKELLRSEWYADFCRPHNIAQGLAATILQERTTTSNIAVFADVARPAYEKEDLALFRALMPHLQRGLRMHMHLAASQSRGQALEAVLHGLPTPVLLVTSDGKALFLNAAAERLIRASDGLLVEGGELRALLPNDTKSLRMLIAGAAQPSAGAGLADRNGRKSGGTVRISRPYAREPLEVLIAPLPSRQDEWVLKQPPVAAVFVTDRSRAPVAEHSMLISLHGLTATEAKVAVAASRGLSGKEICRELGISYNTLKTHLRHIYAKTRTKHQADLVRLLACELRVGATDDGSDRA